jgi:hypothetical protein
MTGFAPSAFFSAVSYEKSAMRRWNQPSCVS